MTPSPNGVQAEILKAARRGQEVFGHAIRTSAGKARSVTPQLHELHLPFADKLPKPHQVAGNVRGITARLPKPEEFLGNVRGMTARLPKPEELAGNARGIAARLPKPEELAGSAASLAAKLMASQRKFTDQVLRVTTPQLPGKTTTPEGGAAKTGTAKTGTAETGTAKISTAKGSSAKSGAAKGSAARSRAAKDAPAHRTDKDSKSE
jgi:hypothetical protein